MDLGVGDNAGVFQANFTPTEVGRFNRLVSMLQPSVKKYVTWLGTLQIADCIPLTWDIRLSITSFFTFVHILLIIVMCNFLLHLTIWLKHTTA